MSLDYYGDETRWFIGKVISINDPLQLGRIRIRIFGVHNNSLEDISEADLPWAQVVVPVTEGSSSGYGANTGIKEQSQVFGMFLDGKDSQLPIVLGAIPKIESTKERRSRLIELSGQTNVEKAFNYFISAEGGEFTPEQTCGIIGNLLVESGTAGDINPLAKNDAEGSFGIAQWNPARAAGNRFDKLKDFSRERGYNHTDLFAQLEFIKYELHKEKYLGLSQLRNAKTPEKASRVFEKYYERPAKGSTDNRIAFAEEVFEKMEA
jgi:hypothetical protein